MARSIDKRGMPKDVWLKHCQTFIGGSNAAAIMGQDKYNTRLDVYLQKTSPEPIVIPDNPLMRLGRELEPSIAKQYAELTGWRIVNDHKIRLHPKYDFIGGDIDRLILSPEHETPGIMEIKTIGYRTFAEWEEGEIPLSYRLQVHHYMMVHPTAKWGVIVAMLRETAELKIYPVEYYPELQEVMEKEYYDFWQNHIEKHIPPPPETRQDILKLFPDSQPVTVAAQESDIKVHGQLLVIKDTIDRLKAEEETLKLEIQKKMLSAELMADGSKKYFIWKSQEQNRLDIDTLKLEKPEIYNQYLKSKTIRVFLTKTK